MKSTVKIILLILGAAAAVWLICRHDLIFQTPPEYWQFEREGAR